MSVRNRLVAHLPARQRRAVGRNQEQSSENRRLTSMNILDETLIYLTNTVGFVAVQQVRLNFHFTVIELVNGDVGASLSYYRCKEMDLKIVQQTIDRHVQSNMDLLSVMMAESGALTGGLLPPEHSTLLEQSVKAALANAQSARIIKAGGDETFLVTRELADDPFKRAHSAMVVGFGGFMQELCEHPDVKTIFIVDFGYDRFRDKMNGFAAGFPEKRILLSNGTHTLEILQEHVPDVICISGSTLCNGTLEPLLSAAAGSRIILQGQSAGIHPRYLFREGVNLVVSTVKPHNLAELAALDVFGKYMKDILDSSAGTVYMLPREGVA